MQSIEVHVKNPRVQNVVREETKSNVGRCGSIICTFGGTGLGSHIYIIRYIYIIIIIYIVIIYNYIYIIIYIVGKQHCCRRSALSVLAVKAVLAQA